MDNILKLMATIATYTEAFSYIKLTVEAGKNDAGKVYNKFNIRYNGGLVAEGDVNMFTATDINTVLNLILEQIER